MNKLRALGFFIALSACLPLVAMAAGTATIKADNGKIVKASWLNPETVRVDRNSKPGYMLLRDGRVYSVTQDNGQPRVIDMSGMIKGLVSMAEGSSNKKFALPEITSMKDTGKSETVAGIKGEVYKVTATTNGKTQTREIVLTDNPTAVELTHVYVHTINSIAGQNMGSKFLNQLPEGRRGILRMGHDFTIESISGNAPSADLFKLPAKPKSMVDFLQNLTKQMQQSQ